MELALSTRWFADGTTGEEAARRARDLGLSRLALLSPGPVGGASRESLRTSGVEACGVLVAGGVGAADEAGAPFALHLEEAAALAARLRAPAVVVEGGDLGGTTRRDLQREERTVLAAVRRGEPADVAEIRTRREASREEATLRAARALHAATSAGVPVAIRPGGRACDLLGLEETGWLLAELPSLSVWLDPARALRAHRAGWGPEPLAWADAHASRTSAVFVHGLGGDLEGGSHPEDVAPKWSTLADAVPGRAPWVLDLDPSLAIADVEDAIRYLRMG